MQHAFVLPKLLAFPEKEQGREGVYVQLIKELVGSFVLRVALDHEKLAVRALPGRPLEGVLYCQAGLQHLFLVLLPVQLGFFREASIAHSLLFNLQDD